MASLELILEAEKRGLEIPDNKKALIAEARKRGLVPQAIAQQPSDPSGGLLSQVQGRQQRPEDLTSEQQQQVQQTQGRKEFQQGLVNSRPFSQGSTTEPLGALTETGEKVSEVVQQGALPGVLGATAGAVGTAAALTNPATAPLAGLIGLASESTGSLVGEGLNQLFGITERSDSQLVASFVLPGVFRGLSRFVKGVAKRLPGSGRALQEIAIEDIAGKSSREALESAPLPKDFKADPRSVIGKIVPEGSQSSRVLFSELDTLNPNVKLSRSASQIASLKDEITKVVPSLQDKSVIRLLDDLDDALNATDAPSLNFENIQANLRELKGKLGVDKNLDRRINKIIGAFNEDMKFAEGRLGGDAGKLLKRANKAFALESFQEDVSTLASKHIKFAEGLDKPITINMRGFINDINQKKTFDIARKSVPGEVKDLLKTLQVINKRTPKTIKAPSEFKNAIVTSSAVGLATGGNPAAISTALGLSVVVPDILNSMLSTDSGRTILKGIVQDNPLTTRTLIAGLQAAKNTEVGKSVIAQVGSVIDDFLGKAEPKPNPELGGL